MSADNWAICPKCKRLDDEKRRSFAKQIKEAYGTLPENEYLEMIGQLNDPARLEETLREDYEIGILNDYFYVSYGAHCDKCGFKHSFNHKNTITM